METNQGQNINSTNDSFTYNIPEPRISSDNTPGDDSKYQPISTWGYVGIILLLGIPFVGLTIAIVWACGGCRKVNKRNFARAFLIMSVIMLISGIFVKMAVQMVVDKMMTYAISAISESQNGDISVDDVMGILKMLEGVDSTSTNGEENAPGTDMSSLLQSIEGIKNIEGIENIEGLENVEDIEMLMNMLGDLSGEVSGGDLSMYEDLDQYEDLLNNLFNDIVFDTKEESTEQQGEQ